MWRPRQERTHAGWEGTVETMRGRGASGTEADFDRIVQYLTDNFGLVNTAAARATAKPKSTAAGYRMDHLRR